MRIGSSVGTVAGFGFLQPREGHRRDDSHIAADAERPVGGTPGHEVERAPVIGWEAEVRGRRVELVLRVHKQLPERLHERVVAPQEAPCVPGPVARQYVLEEGQVAGGKICGPKPAVAVQLDLLGLFGRSHARMTREDPQSQ